LYAHPLALYYAQRPETRDSALAVALRDVGRRPTMESWDVLAQVRLQRGEIEEALLASDRAFAWGAPSPGMQVHRGWILSAMGRETEGRKLLERATEAGR
jgi:hypothetical protein